MEDYLEELEELKAVGDEIRLDLKQITKDQKEAERAVKKEFKSTDTKRLKRLALELEQEILENRESLENDEIYQDYLKDL